MSSPRDPERDPLEALNQGDPGPFEDFVRACAPSLAGFFLRLGAGRAEADDLVQEVFLKLFRNAPSYRPERRFVAYAFRVARNAWIDRTRRQAHRPQADGAAELAAALGDAPDPGAALERSEAAGLVHRALADLPEAQRLVFELGVMQERPYSEIAEALSIPVGTVKSRMFHAVRRLREALGGDA